MGARVRVEGDRAAVPEAGEQGRGGDGEKERGVADIIGENTCVSGN